jgi:class 3 adenylate cyclase
LFSDIEGSTRLLAALGPDEYEVALAEHRSIVRAAIAAHGGVEHGTEGDSFFVTFATSADAVAAAVDAQRALAAHTWAPRPVRVRMGIHAGDVRSTGEDLLGICIHEAERVKSAAHGGQVVTSALARDLAGPVGGGRLSFRSLGRHRLKDLAVPMELFQVCHPDLPGEFPPLRSQTVSSALPTYRSAFIGREREVAWVRELLAGHRLVTLTGHGRVWQDSVGA